MFQRQGTCAGAAARRECSEVGKEVEERKTVTAGDSCARCCGPNDRVGTK